jgi:tetratricopeptide (TPR) repeat protein
LRCGLLLRWKAVNRRSVFGSTSTRNNVVDAMSLAYALANWSGVLIDASRYNESIAPAQECLSTVDIVTPRNWVNGFLALAHLMTGDLAQARNAAELAVANDEPENNPNVQALLGIVAARRHDTDVAVAAFGKAVNQAEQLLEYSPSNYNALDAMAVALAGLAVCGRPERKQAAIAAHQQARAINRDAGVIARLLRLYTALAHVDEHALLTQILAAAQGVRA